MVGLSLRASRSEGQGKGEVIMTDYYPSSSDGWASGHIISDTDHDNYHITLVAGQTYDFYAAGAPISPYDSSPWGQTAGVDPTLTVYDPSGNQVEFNDDGGWGLDSFIDDFVPTTSGSYNLQVDGWTNSTGAYAVGYHNDYEQIDTPYAF
jgi:hypothetical protein